MTGIQLELPTSNLTNALLNLSVKHVISNRGHGQSIGYGHGHDLQHSGLDRAPSQRSRSEEDLVSCTDWQDAQHTLFQLANVCAAVSILTPTSFRHHLLFLRCFLLAAFLFFVLWAGLSVCMLDVLVWNCVFFVVDLVHIISLAYHSIPVRVSPSLYDLYVKRFKPLRVTQKEYVDLCSMGHVVPIRKGTRYALEGETLCGEKVSILIRGRLKVTHNNVFLHCIQPNEFVDSIEFDSVPFHTETAEKFQVTIVATEDSLVLSWFYPTMRDQLSDHRHFVWAVFKGLVGKDVSDKLYKIQELFVKEPGLVSSSAPPTPRSPAVLHNARRPAGGASLSPSFRGPRHTGSGTHPNGHNNRRLSPHSHPEFIHLTDVPHQTALTRGESFV